MWRNLGRRRSLGQGRSLCRKSPGVLSFSKRDLGQGEGKIAHEAALVRI